MPHVYLAGDAGAEFVQQATEIAQTVAAEHAADVDMNARFPREAMHALAERGLYGLCIPSEFGGKGQGPRTFAAVVEELAMACASTAMVYVMHVTASQVIVQSQTLADRASILCDMAAGKHLTTLAFSEKGSRSQFWAPVSTMKPNGDGFVTTGVKSWVTSATVADSYVSSSQKPGAQSPLESTLYLARPKAAGVTVVGRFDGLGLRGNDSAPVELSDVHVPVGDLLTAQGAGAPGMLEIVLPWFCVGTSAMAHGLARAAVAATAGHLSTAGFQHDGTKLRDLPNLRARLSDMSVRTEASRSLLGHTLHEMDAPSAVTPLFVLQSRLSAIECAAEVTDLGMKACGGAAFSKHLPLERLFRDARAGWVMAPTVDHLRDFVGKALTGLPLF